MIKYVGFFMLLASGLTSCSSTKWMNGSWSGRGDQIDNTSWAVELTVENGEEFKIDYPSLSCGGEWTLVEESKDQITFREEITYGIYLCDQGVEIVVEKLTDDEMTIKYFLRTHFGDQPIATAKLKRINRS